MFAKSYHPTLAPYLDLIGSPVAIFELDQGLPYLVSANTRFSAALDFSSTDCEGQAIERFLPRYLVREITDAVTRCAQAQTALDADLILEQGTVVVWWRLMLAPIQVVSGQAPRIIVTASDISETKRLQQALHASQRRLSALVGASHEGIITVDRSGCITFINPSAKAMFGVCEAIVGSNVSELIPPHLRPAHGAYLSGFGKSPVQTRPMHLRKPVLGMRADGREFPIEVTISKIDMGAEQEMLAVIRDLSENTRLIDQLKRAAQTDDLTGTANRRMLHQRLREELARSARYGRPLSLLMLDLNKFKLVNDQFGHHAGDVLLQGVAQCMVAQVRDIDLVGRLGGDEFLVLLPESDLAAAQLCAERITAAVAQCAPDCRGVPLPAVGVSIGIAWMESKDDSADHLIARADAALYREKMRHSTGAAGELAS